MSNRYNLRRLSLTQSIPFQMTWSRPTWCQQ